MSRKKKKKRGKIISEREAKEVRAFVQKGGGVNKVGAHTGPSRQAWSRACIGKERLRAATWKGIKDAMSGQVQPATRQARQGGPCPEELRQRAQDYLAKVGSCADAAEASGLSAATWYRITKEGGNSYRNSYRKSTFEKLTRFLDSLEWNDIADLPKEKAPEDPSLLIATSKAHEAALVGLAERMDKLAAWASNLTIHQGDLLKGAEMRNNRLNALVDIRKEDSLQTGALWSKVNSRLDNAATIAAKLQQEMDATKGDYTHLLSRVEELESKYYHLEASHKEAQHIPGGLRGLIDELSILRPSDLEGEADAYALRAECARLLNMVKGSPQPQGAKG